MAKGGGVLLIKCSSQDSKILQEGHEALVIFTDQCWIKNGYDSFDINDYMLTRTPCTVYSINCIVSSYWRILNLYLTLNLVYSRTKVLHRRTKLWNEYFLPNFKRNSLDQSSFKPKFYSLEIFILLNQFFIFIIYQIIHFLLHTTGFPGTTSECLNILG